MRHLLIFATALFVGCGPKPVVTTPDDTDMCAPACEHLRDLGCEEGEPLEDGTSCEAFCIEVQTSGHSLNPTCVADIAACSEIEECGEH